MRFIRDIFADARQARRPVISFEFFRPRRPKAKRTLLEKTIPALGAAEAGFLLGHLRRRRQHAREDADDRRSHSARAGPHRHGAPDVRQRDA